MSSSVFKCKQCGNCCLNLGAYQSEASVDDFIRWFEAGREDILDWVSPIPDSEGGYIFDIWISKKVGWVDRCPWLRKLPGQNKYKCRIHNMKPEICRNYPGTKDNAEGTGCKGFESEDREREGSMIYIGFFTISEENERGERYHAGITLKKLPFLPEIQPEIPIYHT